MSELNCKNRTVFIGDNLDVMRGLNRGIADAVITDPPFNSNRRYEHAFGNPPSDKKGGRRPGFDDAWTLDDVRAEEHELLKAQEPDVYHLCALARRMHSPGMQAYLIMMATRVLQCRELLKETGSMFLHCDPTANAYLRMLMDAVFGKKNFRNEIIWRKYSGRKNNAKYKFSTQHDSILFYAKSENAKFNPIIIPHSDEEVAKEYKFTDADGRKYRKSRGRRYQLTGEERRIYLDESKGRAMGNLWVERGIQLNTSSHERTGWATQKPVALYERMILAATNAGDLVLDPFCGCATTLVAAERNGRRWLGIDRDPSAAEMVTGQLGKLATSQTPEFWRSHIIIRHDLPQRTDDGEMPHYRQHKRLLYEKQNGRCAGCGYPKEFYALEIDHDIPRSKGGTDHISNLQLLCSRCNRRKGTDRLKHLRAKLRKEGLLWEQRDDLP